MMKFWKASIALLFIFLSGAATAGTTVLGFETSVSTLDQVKSTLAKQTQVQDAGINAYSDGPMLKTDGSAYGIEGLLGVTYIFDDQNKLCGVLMRMSKNRFDAVNQMLRGKYKLISEQRPFVGNQYAKFKNGDVTIEQNAPHLSFEMEVSYLRNDFIASFQARSEEEARQKRASENSKF